MSPLDQLHRFRNPDTYAGEPVCPRCGSGWPVCTDRGPAGQTYTHAETCARYRSSDGLCGRCTLEFAPENGGTA